MKQVMPRCSLPLCGSALVCFVTLLSGCGSSTSVAEASDWTIPLGSYSAIRHSTLKQIDTSNADKMRMAWSMSTGTLRGQEGQPLVVGNMMYFESSFPNYVYAVNLDDVGKIVWKFAPDQDKFAPSVACCDVVNRGVAYADGKIFSAALDTKLYALDAKTGKVLWMADNGDPQARPDHDQRAVGGQGQGDRRNRGR